MKDHFIAVSAGLFDHLADGRLTPAMFAVLLIILRQVDYETGIWRGSAPKIHAALGGQMSLRTIQYSVEKLCRDGYLKSFHRQGRRGNYLVAVDKYPVRFGSRKGSRLDARATFDPKEPLYSCCADNSPASPLEKAACAEGAEQFCTDVARIPDNQIKSRYDTASSTLAVLPTKSKPNPRKAAASAMKLFCREMSEEDAFRLVLWIVYRAANPEIEHVPQIPQSVAYYRKSWASFDREHGYGEDSLLDFSWDRFDKYARNFVASNAPELLEWLETTSARLDAAQAASAEAPAMLAAVETPEPGKVLVM